MPNSNGLTVIFEGHGQVRIVSGDWAQEFEPGHS